MLSAAERRYRGSLVHVAGFAAISIVVGYMVTTSVPVLAGFALAGVLALVVHRPTWSIPAAIVLGSMPTTGILSIFGSDPQRRAAIVLLAAAAAFSAAQRSRLRPAQRRVALGLFGLAFFTLAQASALGSGLVVSRGGDLMVLASIYVVVSAASRSGLSHLRASLIALVGFAVLQASVGISQFVSESPTLMTAALSDLQLREARNIDGYFRGVGTYYHANSLAAVLVLTIPLLYWLRQDSPAQKARTVFRGALLVIALGIVSTLSRTGLALGVVTSVWMYLRTTGRPKVRSGWWIAVCGCATFAAMQYAPLLDNAADRFLGGQADRDAGSLEARTSNLEGAFRAFLEAPLFGHGFGRSVEVGAGYGGQTGLGAHNLYLDLLVGGGVVLFSLAVVVGVNVLRAKPHNGLSHPSSVGLLIFASYGLFESLVQGVFVGYLAILMGLTTSRPRGNETSVEAQFR